MRRSLLVLALALAAWPHTAAAQRVGYVDSEVILRQLPDYRQAEQNVDRLGAQWQTELQKLQTEVEAAEREYAAREVLFTDAERTQRRADIEAKRREIDAYRLRHFGPEGELFREQQQRLRPLQERVLTAIETVAEDGDYDFVLDRASGPILLFTNPRFDLSDLVLEELGVTPTAAAGR
jgi:outer membrane protein